MNRALASTLTVLLTALAAPPARSQNAPDKAATFRVSAEAPARSAGPCTAPGTASRTLAANDVSASLFNTGALFYGGQTTYGDGYVVPATTGLSPIFAAGLWVGGTVSGEVRVAASRYAGYEFIPGPAGSSQDCATLDRIYSVTSGDLAIYAATGEATPDLREWPTGLGAPTLDASGAPVAAPAPGRVIDLAAGERPALYGGQTAFWVMNDLGPHPSSGSNSLGIEVQVTAFGVPSADPFLNQSTVYRYRIINRGASAIAGARASLFVDPDLGDATDDYVGTDVARGMAYVYNADNDDANYGVGPPAVGFDLLTGAGASSYYIGGTPATTTGDPTTRQQVYNYQNGLWADGTVMRAFSNGYGQTQGAVTPFVFTGDPVTGQAWSEVNNGTTTPINPYGDRRIVIHSPGFDLAPGESRDVDVAVLYARGSSNLDSVTRLRAASDLVQGRYDSGALFGASALPAVVAAPVPQTASGTLFADVPPVVEWSPVGGAGRYRVEYALRSDAFDGYGSPAGFFTEGTSVTGLPFEVPANDTTSVFWRVRVSDPLGGLVSRPSEIRRFVAYRFQPGLAPLSDGSPPFVEVVAPSGGASCTTNAFGCSEVGGALVYGRVNPTGQYLVFHGGGSGPELSLLSFTPNDYEIRFTEEGSLAYHAFSTGRISRVPFEVWDVGAVTPGQPNDPSDDVRMVPVLNTTAGSTEAQECTFAFGGSTSPFSNTGSTLGATAWVYAYYPATTYADWAAAAEATDPASCPVSPVTDAANEQIDFDRGRPLQRVYFQAAGSIQSVAELQGTVVRFYTIDILPFVAAEAPADASAGALALGAAAPNPFRQATTLAVDVPTAGRVRVELFDVLGRSVAVLADGEMPAGRHDVRLEAPSLAPGVYVVRLTAGGQAVSRRVTVAR